MTEVLHANIFFLITGIAVIAISTLLCIALFHVVKITRSVRRMVEQVEAGAEVLREDVQDLRSYLSGGGVLRKLGYILFGSRKSGSRQDEMKTRTRTAEKKGTLEDNDAY